jgi:arylsulfatase A-like enzyme
MPTVLELLDVPAPPGLDGRSLAASARSAASHGDAADIVSEFGDAAHGRTYDALRRRRSPTSSRTAARRSTTIVREREDQLAARPDVLAALRDALGTWRDRARQARAAHGDAGPLAKPRDENVRRLRALGYVE